MVLTKKENVLSALILLMSLILRLWAVNFGLPYLYHPDEPTVVLRAVNIIQTGDLNPHFFNYPSFQIYLLVLIYLIFFFFGKAIGKFSSLQESILPPLKYAMGVGKEGFFGQFLLGRLSTVCLGVLSVFLVYAIGKKCKGWKVGVLASFFLAVSPLHVINSKYIAPNVPMAFFVLLSFYFCLRIMERGELSDYLIAGFVCGVAISTKYNAYIGIFPIFLAHYFAGGKFFNKKLFAALVALVIGFILVTPYAVLDFPSFLKGVMYEAHHYRSGHLGWEGSMTWFWNLRKLIESEGFLLIGLAFIGLIISFLRKERPFLLAGSVVIPYFILISSFPVRFPRNLIPLIPFVSLYAAWTLLFLFEWTTSYLKKGRSQAAQPTLMMLAFVLIVGATIFFPLVQDYQKLRELACEDVRTVAAKWIVKNIPAGSKIAAESYTPFLPVKEFNVQYFKYIAENPPSFYKEHEFDYLILSSAMYGRFFKNPSRYGEYVDGYRKIFSAYKSYKVFENSLKIVILKVE